MYFYIFKNGSKKVRKVKNDFMPFYLGVHYEVNVYVPNDILKMEEIFNE